MKYLLIMLITIISLPVHWHYYRWKIFNPWSSNLPLIYRSNRGTLIIIILKIVLFGFIVSFFDWYLIFIPFFLLQILKYIAFNQSLKMETKEFIIHLYNKQPAAKKEEIEKTAKINARNAIFKYKNRKLSSSFLDKIFYYIA